MKFNTSRLLGSFLICIVILLSCAKHQHTNDEIEKAMSNYDSLILRQDADAIAQDFTPDGKLGNAATGRAAIKTVLSKYNNYKVIEQSSTTTKIQIRGDSALQSGTYFQRSINPKNDTIKAMGTFVCKWQWMNGDGWKIKHIVTSSF